MLERLLKESVAEREGWIDSKRVIGELEDHRSGKRDNHTRLWLILCLEIWFRIVTGELDYPPIFPTVTFQWVEDGVIRPDVILSLTALFHRKRLHGTVSVILGY